jgi:hypothetical protein
VVEAYGVVDGFFSTTVRLQYDNRAVFRPSPEVRPVDVGMMMSRTEREMTTTKPPWRMSLCRTHSTYDAFSTAVQSPWR